MQFTSHILFRVVFVIGNMSNLSFLSPILGFQRPYIFKRI